MPRNSIRKRVLSRLKKLIAKQEVEVFIEQFHGGCSSSENSSDDDRLDADYNLAFLIERKKLYEELKGKRYLARCNRYRKGYKDEIFQRHFNVTVDENGQNPWLSDLEFKELYRMSRTSFWHIVGLIKDHEVFKRKGMKRQAPVEYQFGVFMCYLGRQGSGVSNPTLRNMFGIGRGTANTWKKRVVKAIRSIRDEYIKWPDAMERKEIANRINSKLGNLIYFIIGDSAFTNSKTMVAA